MQLAELGELKIIELIKRIAKGNSKFIKIGIGDDCCVFKDNTIVTTDSYLEDVHFSLNYMSLYEIGQRVACGTLSDIAAMAGKPIAVFISALLPSDLKENQLKKLYSGIQSITSKFSCDVAGGDIVAYPKLGLILTAIGKTKGPKLRLIAQPGEYLYVTGYCGLSETGRLVLTNKLSRRLFGQSIKRHIGPIPRINEANKLRKYINALIDTSDGLSTDAFHLSEESKVKIKIYADKLPIHQETIKLAKKLNISKENLVLNGGEDYELLFTSNKNNLPTSVLGIKITQIGMVEKGRGVFLVKHNKEIRLKPKGYEHFRVN